MDRFFKSPKTKKVYTLDTILSSSIVRVKDIDGIPLYFDYSDFRTFVEITPKVKTFIESLEV